MRYRSTVISSGCFASRLVILDVRAKVDVACVIALNLVSKRSLYAFDFGPISVFLAPVAADVARAASALVNHPSLIFGS